MRRLLAIAVATLAAMALAAVPASAATHTKTYDFPVSLKPYEVVQTTNLVPRPNVDGFITGMAVNVVDPGGAPVPIQRLMLHHVVFADLTQPNPMCNSFVGYDSRPYPGNLARPFYGAGEERNVLVLPKGYGYKISKETGSDALAQLRKQWAMVWMLMNHRGVSDHALIRYTVTWDDNPNLQAVHPYWLDVRNCRADPVFDVPGGGARRSTYKQVYDYTMPESGRIVAGGGHVHGGAKNLTVSEPHCNNRVVLKSKPAWGTRGHPFYHVRPILHEPGPISMSGILSEQGYPIAKGQKLRLTASYDDRYPHTRVMGISVVYVAPDPKVHGCQKPPTDVLDLQPAELRHEPYRKHAPHFVVPLTALDENGRAHEIDRPPGATRSVGDGATIHVGSDFFGPPNVAVDPGTTLNWRFLGGALHNVTLANGPRGFSSPNLSDNRAYKFRFEVPGTYRIFCALHPVTMAETVTVRAPGG